MSSVFNSLTECIKFKKEVEEKVTPDGTSLTVIDPKTKDIVEKYNLVRKHHGIRVFGNSVPAPVQVSDPSAL